MTKKEESYGSIPSTSNDDDQEEQGNSEDAISPSEAFKLYEQMPPQRDLLGNTLYQKLENVESVRVRNLCLVHLGFYIFLSVVFFSFIEQWSIVDSVYFSAIVFTTIGYGDVVPVTDAGKLFTVFLSLYGITIIGIALGVGGEEFLKYHSEKVAEVRAKAHEEVIKLFRNRSVHKDDGNSNKEGDSHNQQAQKGSPSVGEVPPLVEDVKRVALRELPVVIAIFVFAIIMSFTQFDGKMSIVSSIYFIVISGTSVGFGDYVPLTTSGRIGCIVFLPFMVAVVGEFLAHVASVYLRRQKQKAEIEFMSHSLTLADLKSMDLTKDGKVTEHEFVVYMLMALQKIEKEDIQSIQKLFKELDQTGTGYLDQRDLYERQYSSHDSEQPSSSE